MYGGEPEFVTIPATVSEQVPVYPGGDDVFDGIYDFEGLDCVDLMPRGNAGDQLTLSYCGEVYVFDNVTTDKVQTVFLHLGGYEFPTGQQGGESYQNQKDFDYPSRCSDPRRAASLNRFRKKRKERCFEKKIRYSVRQEVAFRMNRKKGQFVTSPNPNTSDLSNIVGLDGGLPDESLVTTM